MSPSRSLGAKADAKGKHGASDAWWGGADPQQPDLCSSSLIDLAHDREACEEWGNLANWPPSVRGLFDTVATRKQRLQLSCSASGSLRSRGKSLGASRLARSRSSLGGLERDYGQEELALPAVAGATGSCMQAFPSSPLYGLWAERRQLRAPPKREPSLSLPEAHIKESSTPVLLLLGGLPQRGASPAGTSELGRRCASSPALGVGSAAASSAASLADAGGVGRVRGTALLS